MSRSAPRQRGIVVVAPEVEQPSTGARDNQFEVALPAEAALHQDRIARHPGHKGERSAPMRVRPGVAPKEIQRVAGARDHFEVAVIALNHANGVDVAKGIAEMSGGRAVDQGTESEGEFRTTGLCL